MSLAGQRIGRFKIVGSLGKGSMGEVFLGKDELLERAVALKSIRNLNPIQDLAKTRFLREAKALSKLKHASICQIFDIIEAQDNLFLVLEYIDGDTVRTALEKKQIDKAQALKIAEILCEVLKVAHDKKIVHRDLKPDNIMITRDGQIKVLDFGLVRLLDDENEKSAPLFSGARHLSSDSGGNKTQDGSVVGTVGYLSPEQARGEIVTAASDMYTVGVILCELLTGKRPYPEEIRYPAILFYIGKGRRKTIEEIAPHLEPELQQLLEGLLSADPEARPTARQALESLTDFRDQYPKRRFRRYMRHGLVASLLLFLLWFSLSQRKATVAPLLPPNSQARLAILPFQIQASDKNLDWAPFGMLQLMNESLAQLPQLETIDAERIVNQIKGHTGRERQLVSEAFGVPLIIVPSISSHGTQFDLSYEFYYNGVLQDRQRFQAADVNASVQEMSRRIMERIWKNHPKLDLYKRLSKESGVNRNYAFGYWRTLSNNALTACSYFEICLERDPEFARAKLALAQCNCDMGNQPRAIRLLQEVLTTARKSNDTLMQVDCLRALARIKLSSNEFAESENHLREAWQLLGANASRELCAVVLNEIGETSLAAGEFSEARDNFENALDILKQIHDKNALAKTYLSLGKMERKAGNLAEAEKFFYQVLEISEQTQNRYSSELALLNLVLLTASTGKREAADALWKKLLALVEGSGELASLLHPDGRGQNSRNPEENDDTSIDKLAYVLLSLVSREQDANNWAGALFFLDELQRRKSPSLEDPNAKFLMMRQAFHDGNKSQATALKFELEVRMGADWFNRDPSRKALYDLIN